MQQTKTHKFNLIEPSDTFSPNPLNENMEKVEGALAALTSADAALRGTAADLQTRVATLEAHHIAIGSYQGTEKDWTLELGFTPLYIVIDGYNFYRGIDFYLGTQLNGRIVENGIFLMGGYRNLNLTTKQYNYFAIA